ncbi:MAG TPA: family 16 glycosylhydrolase [Tenuifilaceae bacterium]|nr:family 16 glycosylhydrolase [Tenuifilaceae bacterium]
MNKSILTILLLFSALTLFGQNQLVWSDEFDSESLNTEFWNYDIGNGAGGWGNNELQYYTNRPENISIENGILMITARKELYNGYNYTSARIHSRNKAYWRYGRIEMRAKLPKGRGTWPAFWMLPQKQIYGSNYWPDNGEIDIMEYVGYQPGIVHGSVHTNKNYGGNSITRNITYAGVENDFHIFAIEWSPDMIKFYVDNYYYGNYYRSNRDWHYWPFDQNFFLLLNFAVGGNWGGAQGVDETIFPQTYQIDYVRVYNTNPTSVNDTQVEASTISATPNPTSGLVTVRVQGNAPERSTISVFDMVGNTVIAPFISNNQYTTLDLSHLNAGLYLVKVKTKVETKTLKIVKE